MQKPKRPSLVYRITARSVPDVIVGMEGVVSRHGASRKLTFRGRKYSIEAMLNAVVIDFLSQSPDEQDAILVRGTAAYERMLDATEASEAAAPQPNPPGPRVTGLTSDDPSSEVKPKGRSRRGAAG